MALVINNKTQCLLCNQVITDKEENIGVPGLFPLDDPRSRFNDRALHLKCFRKNSLYCSTMEIINLWKKKNSNKICKECNCHIDDYNDFYMAHLPVESSLQEIGIELFDVFHKKCYEEKVKIKNKF